MVVVCGSGKSYGVASAIIIRALKEKTLVLCTRERQNSIGDSVYSLLVMLINELVVGGYVKQSIVKIMNDEIKFTNGSRFIFKGLSNLTADNIKSLFGVDICWVEEASSLTKKTLDTLLPTIRKEDSQIIFTYNRSTLFDPIHCTLAGNIAENTYCKKLNYYDNPYFPDVLEEERLRCKSTESDVIYSHIWLGEPYSEEHLLITPQDLAGCVNYKSLEYHNYKVKIGVDVARDGNDSSVILIRRHDKILEYIKFKGLHGKELANQISLVARKFTNYTIYVDSIGVGSSVCDFLDDMGYKYIAVNFSKSGDEERHFNKRSECYNRLAEGIREGLEFPNHSEDLQTQLSYVPIDLSNEKIKIKSKDFIKEKLGYSPDISDALAVTYSVMNVDLIDTSNTYHRQEQQKNYSNEDLTNLW